MPIEKIEKSQAVRNRSSFSQVFYNNKFVTPDVDPTPSFSFATPLYETLGSTLDYYGNDPLSIFTSVSKPFIRYTFTGNTDSLSGETTMINDIYKLDYPTFSRFNTIQTDLPKTDNTTSTITEETTSIDGDGNVSRITTNKTISQQDSTVLGSQIGNVTLTDIQNKLNEIRYSTTAITSGFSTNTFDLFPPQFVKKQGEFKEELFEDKGQYFIDTTFKFAWNKDQNLLDYQHFDENSNFSAFTIVNEEYQKKEYVRNFNSKHSILAGTFKGVEVLGRFLTYFLTPNKPILEHPLVAGQLTTFSPTFFFSNVEDGDEYRLQVTYNLSDTGFTSGAYTYFVPKTEENKEVFTDTLTTGSSQFATTKTIRRANASLKGDAHPFLYRIGNVKSLINIFGVKQNVISYSDIFSAITQTACTIDTVTIVADSPWTSTTASETTPPTCDEDFDGPFTLSGYVSGSTVTGATMVIVYPNGNSVTQDTALDGFYSFSGLNLGSYTLNTVYRGYLDDARSLSITGDTTMGIKMKLLWGNAYDTWGQLAQGNFFV